MAELQLEKVDLNLLKSVSDLDGVPTGAFSLRKNGKSVKINVTPNINIIRKEDKPGINIYVRADTKGETVSIPVVITESGIDDKVYNDFYIGKNADVIINAGCGIHNDGCKETHHNGIHRFFLEKGSHVLYQEKHLGTGKSAGLRSIDPVTEAHIGEDAVLEMDTAQIGGVDKTLRKTAATVEKGGKLLIRERILTEHSQQARTEFKVELNGEGSGADIISRSVARDESHQEYCSTIVGNAPCTGHSECDAIIAGSATVDAAPQLWAHNTDAALIHEAAIGKIAGEQILKLRTLGLTEQEAEAKIIEGFLN